MFNPLQFVEFRRLRGADRSCLLTLHECVQAIGHLRRGRVGHDLLSGRAFGKEGEDRPVELCWERRLLKAQLLELGQAVVQRSELVDQLVGQV